MILNLHCKLEFFLIPKNYYAVYLLMILNFFVKQVKPENLLNKIFLHDQQSIININTNIFKVNIFKQIL